MLIKTLHYSSSDCSIRISSVTSFMEGPWTSTTRWSSTFNTVDAKSQRANVRLKHHIQQENKLRTSSRKKTNNGTKHFLSVFKLLVLNKNAFAFIIIFCHASETKEQLFVWMVRDSSQNMIQSPKRLLQCLRNLDHINLVMIFWFQTLAYVRL